MLTFTIVSVIYILSITSYFTTLRMAHDAESKPSTCYMHAVLKL